MAVKVAAPVLYDETGQFLNSQIFGIGADSLVVGTYTVKVNPQSTDTIESLQVKDRYFGTLFLPLTAAEWQERVGIAPTPPIGPNNKITFTATGPTTFNVPAGSWLMSIAAECEGHQENIYMGTYPGGKDILPDSVLTQGVWLSTDISRFFGQNNSTTVYIGGVVGTVNYEIIIL